MHCTFPNGGSAGRRLALFATAFVSLMVVGLQPVSAQLRIVSYNTNGGPRAESFVVLQEIGDEITGGIAKPIDVLLLQEQTGASLLGYEATMDGLYGGNYARATLIGSTSGAGRPGVIYNTQAVQLIGQIAINGAFPRSVLRYQFRPVGYDATADFYIYNSHYKAGDTGSDATQRAAEATAIRTDSDALGDGTHILYAGDFNIQDNGEAMWSTLTGAGAGQAVDPTNPTNVAETWHDNNSFKIVHTQSPVTSFSERFPGQVGGGMDDRFDFQLASGEVLDDEGLALIAGSYHAFGNNGTHLINTDLDEIDFLSGEPFNTALPENVLNAIANSADHIPVVADYQLPAVMGVTVNPAAARVIVGSNPQFQIDVENTANVVSASGADELDYTLTTSGAVTGGPVVDTATALAGPNSHFPTLDTSSGPGAQAGSVDVNSTSQQVQQGSFNQEVLFDVVDHANGSFDGGSDVDMTMVDFGVIGQGQPTLSSALALFNLDATAGFTADLDLDSIPSSGDDTVLTTDLVPVSGIAAAASAPFSVFLDTATIGLFAATYTLTLSDEDLPGEASGVLLTLDLVGRVAIPGDGSLNDSVGAEDYTIWADNFATGTDFETGDYSNNGSVGAEDYTIWADNFGMMASAPAAVPEPSAFVLLALAAFGLGIVRRRATISEPPDNH